MDKREKISVIIPSYNEEENLSTKIPRLSKLSETNNTEIIVVDSPNTCDSTAQILQAYSSVNYSVSENAGRAFQMNLGAKLASGSILLFVHADVTLPENFDNLIRKELKENNSKIYIDVGAIEICSPVHKTRSSLFKWFNKIDSAAKNYKMMPNSRTKGSGGLHINISYYQFMHK